MNVKIESIAEQFRVLGEPVRLRILNLLLKAECGICVCELVDSLNLPQYQISRHLKELKQTSLIAGEKEGRWVYYYIVHNETNSAMVTHLRSILNDPPFDEDYLKLRDRLSLRQNGKCVIGS